MTLDTSTSIAKRNKKKYLIEIQGSIHGVVGTGGYSFLIVATLAVKYKIRASAEVKKNRECVRDSEEKRQVMK